MTLTNKDTLQAQLDSLIKRMNAALSNPDERPVWLHWTDLYMLIDAKNELTSQSEKLETIGRMLMGEGT